MNTAVLKQKAINALRQQHWEEAHLQAVRLIEQDASDPESHFLAGLAMLEQLRVLDAQDHFRQAIALEPRRSDFYLYLARACASSQDYEAALDAAGHAERLMPPENASGLDSLGVVLVQCHAYERAANVFRHAARLVPDDAGIRFNLGTALTFLGDIDGAERELEAAVRISPHHWRAHHSLSQLRKQTPESNHIERLSALAERAVGKVTATTFLNMALAKELEDIGEYKKAFEHYSVGKSAPKDMLNYSRDNEAALFNALASRFPLTDAVQISGCQEDGAIFIVGMPRSGTTLVDRILSSHPLVHSAGELHNFPSVWKRFMGGAGFEMFNPEHISRDRNIDWQGLGEAYLSSTRSLTGSSPFFIDKLPHNFLYVGYIATALPKAKIVCVRRNPMDTCLSNFRQLFAPESPYFDYSYDLMDTGNYYILFDRLMAHWDAAFPGRILQVHYESLVAEQEQNTRRLLSHCGLPWDEACSRFEDNSAPVATASAVQVREGIYRSAVDRWKRYGAQMDDLKQMLIDAGISCL